MEAPLTHEDESKPVSPFQSILGAFQTSEDVEVHSAASDDVSLLSYFVSLLGLLRTKEMIR